MGRARNVRACMEHGTRKRSQYDSNLSAEWVVSRACEGLSTRSTTVQIAEVILSWIRQCKSLSQRTDINSVGDSSTSQPSVAIVNSKSESDYCCILTCTSFGLQLALLIPVVVQKD